MPGCPWFLSGTVCKSGLVRLWLFFFFSFVQQEFIECVPGTVLNASFIDFIPVHAQGLVHSFTHSFIPAPIVGSGVCVRWAPMVRGTERVVHV